MPLTALLSRHRCSNWFIGPVGRVPSNTGKLGDLEKIKSFLKTDMHRNINKQSRKSGESVLSGLVCCCQPAGVQSGESVESVLSGLVCCCQPAGVQSGESVE